VDDVAEMAARRVDAEVGGERLLVGGGVLRVALPIASGLAVTSSRSSARWRAAAGL